MEPRIGDRERDAAVELLREHHTAGRLDLSEFNDRMSLAMEARTASQLAPLFTDLPRARTDSPVRQPNPGAFGQQTAQQLPPPGYRPQGYPTQAYPTQGFVPQGGYGQASQFGGQTVYGQPQIVINNVSSSGVGGPVVGVPQLAVRKQQSFWIHVLLLFTTAGIGNIIYALYVVDWNNGRGF